MNSIIIKEVLKYCSENIYSDYKLLDYGCGYGFYSLKFAELGFKVFAVDNDYKKTTHVRNMAIKEAISNIEVDNVDLEIDSQFTKKFDIILCIEVLEHVKEYKKLLNNLDNILISPGLLIISVPTKSSENVFKKMDSNWLYDSGHLRVFDKNEIHKSLSELRLNKIKILKTNSDNFIYWFFLKIFRIRHTMGIPILESKVNKIINKIVTIFVNLLRRLKFPLLVMDQFTPKSYLFICKK